MIAIGGATLAMVFLVAVGLVLAGVAAATRRGRGREERAAAQRVRMDAGNVVEMGLQG